MKASQDLLDVLNRDPFSWTSSVIRQVLQDYSEHRPLRYEELYSLPLREFQLLVAFMARSRSNGAANQSTEAIL